MVQVIETEDPRGRLTEMLGMSLGKGLGNGLNTYFANRSLENVLKDKSLENAPQSQKLEAIRSALAPYGEKGQQLFNQRLQIDQLENQERQFKEQEKSQKIKGKALGKYLKGQDLSEEEESLFTPQEFVAMHKARNPSAIGGLGGQAVPSKVAEKIDEILKQNPNASADELEIALDKGGVPTHYKKGYIENRRRDQQTGSEHDIKFHQESADFEKGIRKNADSAKKQAPLIEKIKKAVQEDKITPTSIANVAGFFGEKGKKIGKAFMSAQEAELIAALPEFLEGKKEIFGVRLSDADLKIIEDKLPDIGNSKDANIAILDVMDRAAKRALKLEKVSEDILEKKGISYRSGKLRPLGYEREVMKAFDEEESNKASRPSLQEIWNG